MDFSLKEDKKETLEFSLEMSHNHGVHLVTTYKGRQEFLLTINKDGTLTREKTTQIIGIETENGKIKERK